MMVNKAVTGSRLSVYKRNAASHIVRSQSTETPKAPSGNPTPASKVPPRPAARPSGPPVMLGPDGKPLQVVQVEKAGDEAWAGVAAVDKGGQESDLGSAALLASGDVAALLLFAVIGRINHGEVLDVETLATAAPFIIGWFATAPFLGAFGPEARTKGVQSAALTAAKCWAVGTPLGLVLRGLSKGYVPPTPFIIVSLVATGVLLVGWRSALASQTQPAQPLTRAQQLAQRKDKQGNPFEFLQLLFSLVKRW